MPELFGEDDIRAILRRAAERQHTAPVAEPDETGLTLAELQQVAAEAGIAPEHVEAAAAELKHRDPTSNSRLPIWGEPIWVEQERLVEGTLTEPAWEEIVALARQTYNENGSVSRTGQTREWVFSRPKAETYRVTATLQGGSTRLRVESDHSLGTTYGPFLGIGLLLAVIAFLALGGLSVLGIGSVLGIMSVALLTARKAHRYRTRHQQDKARTLADKLERIVGEHAPVAAPNREADIPAEPGRTLPLPEVEPPTPEPPASERNRARS